MAAVAPVRMTYAEYVAAEEKALEKHEFLDGVVYAMSGGTPAHAALAMAFGRLLGNAIAGRPCRVFSSDARVRVGATGLATHPDLTVVCGKLETDPEDRHAIANPVLVVEILSESTEALDRGQKAADYRRIPSLREYVLVAQDRPSVEVFRRGEGDGPWELREYGPGQSVELASVGCAVEVDGVYRDPLA